ncbi:SRPBCC family protein, partial [Arthrobacter agilis]|uniref:SRPBCC family protein n=1 Tax=Arthrobacter agilis TaxID=37921 RepID=UPI003F6D8E70
IGGTRREFDAEITEQHPAERGAWQGTDGGAHAGVGTVDRLGESATRPMVQVDWHPETFTEKVGAVVNAATVQVKGDLKRFKAFIEKSGGESGAWRGDVEAPPTGGTS